MARLDSEELTWQQAMAVLSRRGWDRSNLLDDVLALVASAHFRWEMPLPLIGLAVRNDLAPDEAHALLCVARTWLLGDPGSRDALEAHIRDLPQARRRGLRRPEGASHAASRRERR